MDKDKMSRALGTAFLTHQVAQLELETNGSSKLKGNGGGGAWTNYHRGVGGGGGGRRSTPTPSRKSTEVKAPDNTISPPSRPKILPREVAKEADRIIVDASVLIHAIGRVRSWCRDSSSSILIVPLEALNTLDLLKKGTSKIAQRARAASRLLEAQVGANGRVTVQSDTGYIPWDKVQELSAAAIEAKGADPSLVDLRHLSPPPEWLKRTVCCAAFEQDAVENKGQKVVLAVVANPLLPNPDAEGPVDPPHRYEARAIGELTKSWASVSGLEVLEIAPDEDGSPKHITLSPPANHKALPPLPEVNRRRKDSGNDLPSPRTQSRNSNDNGRQKNSNERNRLSGENPRGGGGGYRGRRPSGGGLVEKPSAPIPLTNAGLLPAGKVIRLLARGEKLDP